MKFRLIAVCAIVLTASLAVAQTPEQETRAKTLYKDIRCPVCTTQSISESDATLTLNLRKQIMADIISGKTDAEIVDRLSGIYGDDILLRPRTEVRTLPLWLAPWLILTTGLVIFLINRRKHTASSEDNE